MNHYHSNDNEEWEKSFQEIFMRTKSNLEQVNQRYGKIVYICMIWRRNHHKREHAVSHEGVNRHYLYAVSAPASTPQDVVECIRSGWRCSLMN